jgi:hypothetical protein
MTKPLADALQNAGVESAQQRMERYRSEAVRQHPRAAGAAVRRFLSALEHDGGAAMAFARSLCDVDAGAMKYLREAAIAAPAQEDGGAIGQVRHGLGTRTGVADRAAAETQEDGGGVEDRNHCGREAQAGDVDHAASAETRESAGQGGRVTAAGDGQRWSASPPVPSPARRTEPAHITAIRLAAANSVAFMRSEAGRAVTAIMVDGQSIMESNVTTEHVLTWCDHTDSRTRLARAVCHRIPDPRRPIREQMTVEIAEEAMREAEAMARIAP